MALGTVLPALSHHTREHDGKDYGGKAKVKEVQQKGEVI